MVGGGGESKAGLWWWEWNEAGRQRRLVLLTNRKDYEHFNNKTVVAGWKWESGQRTEL